MEPTNNNETRGRGRGRRGRGVRTRGSMTARGARGQRGAGRVSGDRPSVSEPLFRGTVESLPQGQHYETALTLKRKRVLPAPTTSSPRSENLWSSLDVIAPSMCHGQGTSPLVHTTPQHELSAPGPSVQSVECGAGNQVIPVPIATSPRSENLRSLDVIAPSTSPGEVTSPLVLTTVNLHELSATGPSVQSTGVGEPSGSVGEPGGKRRRCLFPPSRARPLNDSEISNLINYGSEEESDDEEDENAQVPRVASWMRSESNEEVEEGCIQINLEWPPQPRSRSSTTQHHPVHPDGTGISPTPIAPTSVSPTPTSSTSLSAPSEAPPMEPTDKFKFIWRRFPEPQIDPLLRRETFSQINTGPTVSVTNPYEAFTAIWDREIMERIARETNIYAQQLASIMLEEGTICPGSRITRWHDTDVDELYRYFALVMAMGIVNKSRLEEYWSTSKNVFSTHGFAPEMTYNRFQLLSRCLHFNNNQSCEPELLTRPQAKLFKLQPIIDHLNSKFSQLYNLSLNIALDESLTMWKGWLDINQFIPNKAATVGIKTYEVCESQTGYLWRFEVHAGYDISALQDHDPVSGKVPALVLRLLNGLEHKGHTVWMDNFYNSPALARELKSRGIDCVGTLRTNRQFVPTELASLSKTDMAVGEVFGCTSGDVDLMVMRDKNRVAFISTYHGIATTRCGDSLKPTVVADYNLCMGGVDKKDQQLAMFPIARRRTRVWYKKFFRRLLNASVLNSYLLLKSQSLTQRKFRMTLITDLLTKHKTPTPLTYTPTTTPIIHSPAQYNTITPGKSNRFKRNCVVCKKRTITYCEGCDVAMCMFTCYKPYHSHLLGL